jgi:tRNA 2-thiouridine synthesizing protein E
MTATMIESTLAERGIVVDKEGFLQQPDQWTPALGEELAASVGITMGPRHWDVVNFMRNTFLESGSAPTIRTLGAKSGVPVKELYALFPKGPAKLAAKIGGIPKPKGCI